MAILGIVDLGGNMEATLTAPVSVLPFKQCPMCQFGWGTREDFQKDAGLRRIGHQAGVRAQDPGLIMFTHNCGTTLVIEAEGARGL